MCVCVSLSNNKGVEKNWFTLTDGKYNRKGDKRRNRKNVNQCTFCWKDKGFMDNWIHRNLDLFRKDSSK